MLACGTLSVSLLGAQGGRLLLVSVDVKSYSAGSAGYGCSGEHSVCEHFGCLGSCIVFSLSLSLSLFFRVEFLCAILAVMKLTL